ncbi:MAG: cupredoxin domain-containing protein [Croceibacterium sp.]
MRRSFAAVAILLASQMPLAGLTAQGAAPETVSVELSNFKFTPSALALQSGHLYRLHLVNAAGGGHDFSAPEFFAASAIAPEDQAKVVGGKVKLEGKQSVDVTLTPQKAGTYPLTCTHFMHSGMGMKGQITIG